MLGDCLRTLYAALDGMKAPPAYEVILVDNGSTDGSVEMMRQDYPQVQVIPNTENQGFARANNQAIRLSRGRYVLMLNTDAFIDSATLDAMLALLDAHPEIGVAGPTLVYPDGSPQVSHGPLPSLRGEILSLFGIDQLVPSKTGDLITAGDELPGYVLTGTVEGASLFARRSALDAVGLMDERFFFFSEEVDLCCRIQLAGWEVVYVPETRVVHKRGASTGIVPRRVLLLYKAKLQYFEKHSGDRVRDELLRTMRIATNSKVLVYRVLEAVHLRSAGRADLWQEVGNGLQSIDRGKER